MDIVFPPTMPHSQVRRSLALIVAVQLNGQATNYRASTATELIESAKKLSQFISEREDTKD